MPVLKKYHDPKAQVFLDALYSLADTGEDINKRLMCITPLLTNLGGSADEIHVSKAENDIEKLWVLELCLILNIRGD